MKRLLVPIAIAVLMVTFAAVGCSQSAPAPTPTKAPAADTKSVEPTKAPASTAKLPEPTKAASPTTKATEPTKAAASQPTSAPSTKTAFPEKGKAITLIVPYPPGGGVDGPARLLAPLMEKELGVPVTVVNKAGAGSQVGITELAKSKPDGYTIGYASLPPVLTIYLDPERQAAFGRKDLQPIGLHVVDTGALVVKADSPYKSVKDLVDAAKAKPGALKGGTDGLLAGDHLATIYFNQLAGVDISLVHFDGAGPANLALAGGHIDVRFSKIGSTMAMVKSGQFRVIGIMDKQESEFCPGVKTMEAQGYKMYFSASRGICAPAGTPKEIVDKLSAAMKKGVEDPDHVQKMKEQGMVPQFMGPEQFAAYWDELETTVKPLLDAAKKQ